MRVTCQRVEKAICRVEGVNVGSISNGLLVFVGFSLEDDDDKLRAMAKKIAHARLFEDERGKMNLSVMDVQGSILSISQFTLYGDTRKGNRPSYDKAAKAEVAKDFYERFNTYLQEWIPVEAGVFQADMKIEAHNDGPVTLWYEN